MRGRIREVVIYFKFHENGPGVLELWGVENRPLPLTWPMAYTTACTTVQAVIQIPKHDQFVSDNTSTTASKTGSYLSGLTETSQPTPSVIFTYR